MDTQSPPPLPDTFAPQGGTSDAAPIFGDILAPAFGITLASWLVAYASRVPLVNAPAPVTVILMLAAIFAGGFATARFSSKGLKAAVLAGAISGLINLLILGSALTDATKGNPSLPNIGALALGSIFCNALVAGAGGLIGMLFPSPTRIRILWPQILALILAAATLPLITAGGLVTAFHAGLAVPDWPTSYGSNMFLFSLSQMQANHGQFYEHAHRLMGSLVGLTSLALALHVTLSKQRAQLVLFAWLIFVAVCLQGVIGGTRVTEKNIALAITHGIFAQIVFAAMCCLAGALSRAFASEPRTEHPAAHTERFFTSVLVAACIVQLILGALVRHIDSLLMVHIVMATLVAALALAAGFRAWGLHGERPPMRRAGIAVMVILLLQLLLGILALALRSGPTGTPTNLGAVITTIHQANGALLLATASVLMLWTWRLLRMAPSDAGALTGVTPAASA